MEISKRKLDDKVYHAPIKKLRKGIDKRVDRFWEDVLTAFIQLSNNDVLSLILDSNTTKQWVFASVSNLIRNKHVSVDDPFGIYSTFDEAIQAAINYVVYIQDNSVHDLNLIKPRVVSRTCWVLSDKINNKLIL